MLNPIWIRSFLGVAQHRSFQLAGEALGIAQPTVSLHIQKLEEQLGVLLFRRARLGCEPTAEARTLLPYAQGLMRLSERAIGALNARQVRIGASSNIGIYLLPPLLKRFRMESQDDDCELLIDRNPAIADYLEHGEIDIALMEWWDERPGFDATCWRQEPIVVIVPPDHAWAGRSIVGRDELASVPLLGGEPGTGTGRLLQLYFEGSQPPEIALRLGSTEAVKQAVKAGLGISMVLAATVSAELTAGSLHGIPLNLAKPLYVVWRHTGTSHLPPPCFVTFLLTTEPAV